MYTPSDSAFDRYTMGNPAIPTLYGGEENEDCPLIHFPTGRIGTTISWQGKKRILNCMNKKDNNLIFDFQKAIQSSTKWSHKRDAKNKSAANLGDLGPTPNMTADLSHLMFDTKRSSTHLGSLLLISLCGPSAESLNSSFVTLWCGKFGVGECSWSSSQMFIVCFPEHLKRPQILRMIDNITVVVG